MCIKHCSSLHQTNNKPARVLIASVTAQVQQITSQPQDAVIKEGQLIVLNCVVANLVGNVQWLRDGFGLGPGPTFVESFPRYSVDVNTNTGACVPTAAVLISIVRQNPKHVCG
jgi:hypothetical protein